MWVEGEREELIVTKMGRNWRDSESKVGAWCMGGGGGDEKVGMSGILCYRGESSHD